ncbi:MAG TPA: hypothetical protein PK179_08530 [Spirochaetales bacterium]|nr:hypothetical protein [Spirochaetales bacterium]
MQSSYNLWDPGVWSFVFALAILFLGMIAANALIRLVKPLRNMLIPSSVLGGFMLVAFLAIMKAVTGKSLIEPSTLEMITYHGLGLGCTALALKVEKKTKRRHAQRDIFNSALVTTSGYLLQVVIGLSVSFALYFVLAEVWPASGMLLPMGYGQGPGQAYNWAHTYETSWGFANGTSFGLTVSSVGFIACSIGGITFLNLMRLRRNPKATSRIGAELRDEVRPEDIAAPNEVPLSDTLDKMTLQFGLVFLTYALAFGIIYALSALCDLSGVELLTSTVKPLIWGFNFIFAALAALLVQGSIGFLTKKKVIEKQYFNNLFLERISNVCFDLMIAASIAAINLSAFRERSFVIPMVVMCVLGMVGTYFFVEHATKKLFPTYSEESFLSLYGMLTGVVGTGIILLRQIDPGLRTPASKNLVFQTIWAVLTGFPMLLLMGFAPRSNAWIMITLGICAVMFLVFYGWIRLAARGVARSQASDYDDELRPIEIEE